MATGYAKATGRIGVCLATSGPGGIHLLNGLYDAKLDHVPVLAITGMQETSVLGTGYQQEVAPRPALRRRRRVQPDDLQPGAAARAWWTSPIRTAYARRGVAHLTVPERHAGRRRRRRPVAARRAGPLARSTAPIYAAAPRSGRADEDLQRPPDVLNAGEKIAILAGAGALHARAELLARRGHARRADRQDAVRQGGRAGRLPLHHRRDRAARHQAVRGADGRHRHAVHGRHQLPLHQAPARAGQGPGRPDRGRPGPGRRPDRHRGAGGRRRQGRPCRRCCRCSSARPTARSWRSTSQAMAKWREQMAALENAEPRSDRAAVPRPRHRRARRRRRHPDLRQRHDRDLGGAALDDPRRPAVLPVRQPGHHGPGLPYAIGIQHAVPGTAGHRVRRRRRLRHADGRVPHRGPAPAADQGGHQQQQLPRPDPVGADGARLSRARRPVPEPFAGLRGLRGRQRRPRASRSSRPATLAPAISQALAHPTARPSSTSTSTRTSRRCPARSTTSRRRSSPRPSCKGQPRKATIATTLFKDKIEQLKS